MSNAPAKILQKQQIIQVSFFSFDNKIHQGQIMVNKGLVNDVQDAFKLLQKEKFPITSVILLSDPKFHWDDELSMKANNTSGFNYRVISETNKLSKHAYGKAIDINPLLNPYIKGNLIQPQGAVYDPSILGTITVDSPIVTFLKNRGWTWGGDWEGRKDYQHFEKY